MLGAAVEGVGGGGGVPERAALKEKAAWVRDGWGDLSDVG